jgi:hypothetical protein
MYGVGVSEDVVRRLPIGVLVGIAEVSHAECGGISERTAEVGRSGSPARTARSTSSSCACG